jgi:hypothetical protein
MKILNAKIFKEGVGKNGKAYTIVHFQDENGRQFSSFDTMLVDLVNGSDVDGDVTETSKDGKTYLNFKASGTQSNPLQLAAIPVPTAVDQAVAKAPQAPTVPQDVWERKDLAMLAMNCNNAASQVYSATALKGDHMTYAIELFDYWNKRLNGKPTLSENYAKVLEQVPPTPPAPTDAPDEISLDSIPF